MPERKHSLYQLTAFPDGTTAIVASRIDLGDRLFEGTLAACRKEQKARCRTAKGFFVLRDKPAPARPRKATKPRIATATSNPGDLRSIIPLGTMVQPLIPGYMGLDCDQWYRVWGISQPLRSPLVNILVAGDNTWYPYYATYDLQSAFRRMESPHQDVPRPTRPPGPILNGERVRPVVPGSYNLADHWHTISSILKPDSGAPSVFIREAGQYIPLVDRRTGKPNLIRFFEVFG